MIIQANRNLVADALESGRFIQGLGSLCQETPDGPRYCCLGVACEVFIENGGALEKRTGDRTSQTSSRFSWYGDCALRLPKEVQDWLDIDVNGTMTDGQSLALLNDRRGWTFDRIAPLFRTATFRGRAA